MAIRKRVWTSGGELRKAWIVDYRDGAGVRRQKTFAAQKAAKAWAISSGYEIAQGVHTAASVSPTVAEAGAAWIADAQLENLERSTVRQYRQHLDLHIVPYLGGVKLSDLTTPMVADFRRWMRDNGRSPAMCRKVVTSLGSLVADAQENGKVAHNAVRSLPRKRRASGQAKRHNRKLEVGRDVPTPAEVNAALAVTSGRDRAVILTAARTGIRASELRGLRWCDVDLEAKQLHVRQRADQWKAIGSPKSAAGTRCIPMTKMLVNTLREWKLACPKSDLDLVFPTSVGTCETHANLYRRTFCRAWVKAGVTDETGAPRYGVHALRHFAASWFINPPERGGLGMDLKRAQVLLGHSSLQMTADRYGHLLPAKGDESETFSRGEQALMA